MADVPDAGAVRAAASVLAGVVHRTPVVRARTLDEATGSTVFLKCENLQRTGAFKFRGAYHAAAGLAPGERAKGLAAFSSGNHAQAVALAARLLGTTAVILMPKDAPRAKVEAVRGYGAEVVTYDRYREDRVALGTQLARERGAALVPPYDHRDVIAGQGTAALELLEDAGDLDVLVVPIGGGGLAAGCATIATAVLPRIEVVGVEPEAGDDTRRSLAAGHRVPITVPRTIADGLAVETPGELTFSVNQRLLARVEVVSDDELRAAMRFAFDRLKLVVEPSGAAGIAAVLAGRACRPGARVGIVLSGGNVDTARFAELLATPTTAPA